MTIAEASRKYGLTADTLRYYERIGLLPPVPRTKGGIRDYDEASCGWIELMKCLRSAGLQIGALIKYAALCQAEGDTNAQRIAILRDQRDQMAGRIAEMQRSLDRLNRKIAAYDNGSWRGEPSQGSCGQCGSKP